MTVDRNHIGKAMVFFLNIDFDRTILKSIEYLFETIKTINEEFL